MGWACGGVRHRALIPRHGAGRVGASPLGYADAPSSGNTRLRWSLLPFLARASGSCSSRFVHLWCFLWRRGIWLSRVPYGEFDRFEKERVRVIVVGAFACCNKRAARVEG